MSIVSSFPKSSFPKKNLSKTHRAIQEKIVSLLPEGECSLEKKIGAHRADVFWEVKAIVFEVQCSPISLEEAYERSYAYQKSGLSLVWILHSKVFNKKRICPSEYFLRSLACYYTAMTSHMNAGFYDQMEIFHGNKRLFRSSPLWIDLSAPSYKEKRLIFLGDRFSQEKHILKAFEEKKKKLLKTDLFSRIKKGYYTWLHRWLKKISLP